MIPHRPSRRSRLCSAGRVESLRRHVCRPSPKTTCHGVQGQPHGRGQRVAGSAEGHREAGEEPGHTPHPLSAGEPSLQGRERSRVLQVQPLAGGCMPDLSGGVIDALSANHNGDVRRDLHVLLYSWVRVWGIRDCHLS